VQTYISQTEKVNYGGCPPCNGAVWTLACTHSVGLNSSRDYINSLGPWELAGTQASHCGSPLASSVDVQLLRAVLLLSGSLEEAVGTGELSLSDDTAQSSDRIAVTS
jgi:hypothetical protein